MSDLICTDHQFERPPDFSARAFLLDSLRSDDEGEDSDHLISVHIQGSPQALDDLCGHWLLGHALVERTAEHAHFKLDELKLYTQIPYYLLSYGGKIRILEPEGLKSCMIDIMSSLLDHYQS